jgi:hypothetical protein
MKFPNFMPLFEIPLYEIPLYKKMSFYEMSEHSFIISNILG